MKRIARQFWRDEQGTTSIGAMILVTSVVALAGIVGLASVQSQIIQQFGNFAVGLDRLDQSFSYTVRIDTNLNGSFADPGDILRSAAYVDPAPTLTDPANAAPACISFTDSSGSTEATQPSPTGVFP